ncbi:hypothetical protein ABZ208_07980 [Streptomyces sp. NPDC006208]|uniref:hypothetical protein n=1 Tax=Streptomyces sp. NPDC006208 TaxID=3156734 RepID=UPI0033B1617D
MQKHFRIALATATAATLTTGLLATTAGLRTISPGTSGVPAAGAPLFGANFAN